MYKVELKVIEARNLVGRDFGGLSSDPFCKVITRQGQQQTQTVYKTRNPSWNRSFELMLSPNEDIRFELVDYDTFGKNDSLGYASYRFLGGHVGQTVDTWLAVSKKGELHIQIIVKGGMNQPGMGAYPPGAYPPAATAYPPPYGAYPPPGAYPPAGYPPPGAYPPPPMNGPGGYPLSRPPAYPPYPPF